jgi:hypothetical protein
MVSGNGITSCETFFLGSNAGLTCPPTIEAGTDVWNVNVELADRNGDKAIDVAVDFDYELRPALTKRQIQRFSDSALPCEELMARRPKGPRGKASLVYLNHDNHFEPSPEAAQTLKLLHLEGKIR